ACGLLCGRLSQGRKTPACDNPRPSVDRPRDEIGRRSGLKIRRRKARQFESGRGHHGASFARHAGLRTENNNSRMPPLPPVTQALLLINVGIFCLQFLFGFWIDRLFALWPLSGGFLPWQVVTYAFLHGSRGPLFFHTPGLWMCV